MSHYRKIDTRIWNDEKFRSLSDLGKLAFLFLLTHPHMTMIGAMRASLPGLAAEIGWSPEAFEEAFHEASAKGMAEHDERASLIWLPRFLKYNPPESPNVVKSWVRALDLLPECPLLTRVVAASKDFAEGLSKAFQEALPEAFRKAIRNQEQEQEQDKTHAHAREPSPDGDAGSAGTGTEVLAGNQSAEQSAAAVQQELPMSGTDADRKDPGKAEIAAGTAADHFERFWTAFPKKVGKGAALTAWKKVKRPAETVDLIITALSWQVVSPQWTKDNGAYIPHPATYLNQQRWLDEPATAAVSGNRHSGFGGGKYNLGSKAELKGGNRVMFRTGA